MTSVWHRLFSRFIARLYFDRVTVLHAECLPHRGPTLYVGLHRNGAVDGFVFHSILPRATFLIARQLGESLLGRVFFTGIEVVRSKDKGDRSLNAEAMERCVAWLCSGGELFIFPEGTSTLGPRHLPFHSGAARIAMACLDAGSDVCVIPLGIAYDCPWEFRSRVEVVVGSPLSTLLRKDHGPEERLRELRGRLDTALESLGMNVESEDHWEAIQVMANLAALTTSVPYFHALKFLEQSVPNRLLTAWRSLEEEKRKAGPFLYHGAPLFPRAAVWQPLLALALLIPGVFAAALLNVIPLLGAWWAGKKFADDLNVVSLWRILAGIPLFLLWFLLLAVAATEFHRLYWFSVYVLVTLFGLIFYSRAKRLAVAVGNAFYCSELRPTFTALREALREELAHEIP